jgi:predicted porin
MKLARLTCALFGAYACAAAAQSSNVVLFGTIDLASRVVKADGQSRRFSEAIDGINSSQFALRGTEDLGGGLKAGFTLLAGLNADNGTANAKFWNRRSTVSLIGNFGEIRLGRDYIPTFWNFGLYDAFGVVGLGATANVRQMYGGTRMDNAISYILPAGLRGFYGQAMVAAGEGGTSADRPGRHIGARFGYAAGPLDIGVAAAQQRFGVTTPIVPTGGVIASAGSTQKTWNVGASYDFGLVKVMGYFDRETLLGHNENTWSLSGIIPFGQSEVHAGYDRSQLKLASGASTTIDQLKATYVYNLSKRTAVYSTVSRLDNKDASRVTLPGAAGPTTARGQSTGAEFGIRHFF